MWHRQHSKGEGVWASYTFKGGIHARVPSHTYVYSRAHNNKPCGTGSTPKVRGCGRHTFSRVAYTHLHTNNTRTYTQHNHTTHTAPRTHTHTHIHTQDHCTFDGTWRGPPRTHSDYYVSSYFWDKAIETGIIKDTHALTWSATPNVSMYAHLCVCTLCCAMLSVCACVRACMCVCA